MSKYQTPYRYDFVGSFLRPQEVKQAKADYSEGKITKEECDAIKNKYHLPMDKKIVLYAPTWRDNSYVSAGYTFEYTNLF